MADLGENSNFIEEIELLESMFGGTVSATVIASVIESCDGNVHIAADAIMNFSDEMSTLQLEEDSKPSKEDNLIELTSTLNVAAPPFELPQLQANTIYQTPVPIDEEVTTPAGLDLLTSTELASATVEHHSATPTLQYTSASEHVQKSPKYPKEEIPPSPQSSSAKRKIPVTGYQQHPSTENHQPPTSNNPLSTTENFRNSGTIPKKPPDSKPNSYRYSMNVWSDQVGKILHSHNKGTRTLIIMRGAAGSGKTYLAKHIVDYTVGPSSLNYARHIFSSDNYFMRAGFYRFDRNSLDEAHASNKRNVCNAANTGVSPIIVDNTNTELWEMEAYIRDGVRNGYIIEFVEPNTSWSRNVNKLANRNLHGVPRESIRRMLDRFDRNLSPEVALKALRLSYMPNKKPPQQRNIPPFSPPESLCSSPKRGNTNNEIPGSNSSNGSHLQENVNPDTPSISTCNNVNHGDESVSKFDDDNVVRNDEYEIKLKKIIEAQKNIEQFEQVEQEWENGESWESTTETKNDSQNAFIVSNPKPPRATEKLSNDAEKFIKSSSICDDWTRFMAPWPEAQSANPTTSLEAPIPVESISVSTCFEVGDMNDSMHKVLYCIPRNINEGITKKTNKPKSYKLVIMVDKSTSTHENDFLSKKDVCKNKERHFKELRRMFKSVPRDVLRDIYESCNFEVNWAVNLLLDSYPDSQIDGESENISDSDDDSPIADCNCLAGYSIIPDVTPSVESVVAPEPEPLPTSTPIFQKKPKREKTSDDSLQLKRQIESNVIISDNHYSQHYLNLRRRRETNLDGSSKASGRVSNPITEDGAEADVPESDVVENATALPATCKQNIATSKYKFPTFPTDPRDVAGPSTSSYNLQFMDADPVDSDNESDSNQSSEILEKTVTINLGHEFVTKLDEVFGRKDFQYPGNIQPVITLPMSILQQINAHWAMSVAVQLDDGSRQSEAMIKQDEEFARQVAAKEQEMSDEGREPEVPSMREILDMELAYAINERSVNHWRLSQPQDLAARLTREKLYNLFPDLSKEVLSEMLMAHDYSFKDTIESLIISTGQVSWLEDEKGVEKFVMHKEMERKTKFLEEQKKSLDETEWPYLLTPDKPVTLETVNYYRAKAEKSLQCRNANFEKARQYFARNSPSAASFYSDIAALHTRRYEQSSCLAAAYLMNYHLKNNPDHDVLDLHFLRVAEAMVNLDIFIDQIILRLRNKSINYKETWIITGKGVHSVGGPRIKPATKRRLKAREITMKQVNGGLIMATLYSNNKLTSELGS